MNMTLSLLQFQKEIALPSRFIVDRLDFSEYKLYVHLLLFSEKFPFIPCIMGKTTAE